jgi:ParB family transcriptional regulator, chromosome partitioning protein
MSQVQELRELSIDAVLPNPAQPRRRFDEEALKGLAGSLSERGVLQPVLVRPLEDGRYGLIVGERRWRAAKLAGLQTIPALVSRYDDLAALEAALIENMAREDLNPVEEARACETLVRELGLSHGQIADHVGRARSTVVNLIRLLNLSEEILELLERGKLSAAHGRVLLAAKNPESRPELARRAIEEGWSVRVLEARASASNLDVLASQQDHREQTQGPDQAQDLMVLNLARAWGDLLGAEVHVRPMPRGQMRLEVSFDSAAEGIELADRLAAAIARGSKGT